MTRARNIAGFSTITTTPSPVHVGPIGVLTATRIDGEFNVVDIETRDLTAQGIGVTNLQVSGITTGLNVSGIITAQNGINFNGTSTGLNVSGIGTIATLNVTGNATIDGNANIGGVLTYEDVTNVDSVGVVTARGLDIFGNTTGLNATGVSTFTGDVSIARDIIHTGDTDTFMRFDTDTIKFDTGGVTRFTLTGGNVIQQSGTFIVKNAVSDSTGLKISQESSNESRIFNHYSGPITFGIANTEKLRVDSSGRLLIGTTTEGTVDSDDLTIATSGNTGLTIRSGTTSNGAIHFSDATSGAGEYAGYLDYDHNDDSFDMGNNSGRFLHSDSNRVVSIGNASFGGSSGVKAYGSTGGIRKDSLLALNASATVAGRGAGVSVGGNSSAIGSFYCSKSGNNDSDGGDVYLENQASSGNLRFHTNSNERMRINSLGQISIRGTTTAFDTTGDLDSLQMYYETDSGQASIGPYSSGGNTHLSLYTNASGAAATEKVRISAAGQVRINTAGAPSADLHVGGSSGVLNALFQTSRSSGAYHKYALGASGADLGYIGSAQQISSSGQADGFAFRSENHIEFCAGGSTERIRIDDNGNLVIGHAAANAKLQINSGTSNAVGDETNPAIQIGGTSNYRLAMLTTSEAGVIYNKNGDDGIRLQTKSGNSTPIRFIVYPEQINGQDNYANTNTGALNTSQTHPTGVFEYRSRTDQGVEKYNSYIQSGAGGEADIYITIRNSGFYRITVKASHNSTQADVAMYLVYGLNSQVAGNRITQVVSTGNFTVTDINSRLNNYDSTIKISYSGSLNQSIRALVEVIGGF